MKKIYLGKIVNTHGLKGEIKLLSNISIKDKVFVPGMPIYIKDNKEIINSYRHHKVFDMITLKGIDTIDDVIKYKGFKVYIDLDDIKRDKDEYVLEELVGYKIIDNNECLGNVREIVYNNSNILLAIDYDKNYYIPANNAYIKEVDKASEEIQVENVKGLIL